jgi:hypothetical protein
MEMVAYALFIDEGSHFQQKQQLNSPTQLNTLDG